MRVLQIRRKKREERGWWRWEYIALLNDGSKWKGSVWGKDPDEAASRAYKCAQHVQEAKDELKRR